MDNSTQTNWFSKNFHFQKIFQSFRIAVHPKNLIIAFIFLTCIWSVGRLMDLNPTVVASGDLSELDIYMLNSSDTKDFIDNNKNYGTFNGVFETIWKFGQQQLDAAVVCFFQLDINGLLQIGTNFLRAVFWAFQYHPIYSVFFGLFKLAALAIAGGAICRISALQFAKGEKPGLFEALWFSSKKFSSFFAAPLVPICIILFLGLIICIIGLLANIPYAGVIILCILMPLALLLALLAAIITLGTAAGFGLMYPVIAYEGSDSFDSTSRAFSYFFAKPWRTLFYDFIAFIYGFACFIFVWFFAFLLLFIARMFLKTGVFINGSPGSTDVLSDLWPELTFTNFTNFSTFSGGSWLEKIAAILILVNLLIISGLVLSFLTSFFFTANTIIYALIRKQVDGTEESDIYTRLEEDLSVQIKVDKNS